MEQAVSQLNRRVTEDEYLRMEEAAKSKHEFRNGKIIDMAGGTWPHARIAANLVRRLGEKLENSSCQAVGSDVRVRINETGNYCYPDVTVICGTPIFDPPDRQMNVTNPKAVIEVTSPSSEADDHGEKVDDYRLIDSLQEYLIVSQDRIRIETYYRQSDSIWAIGPALTDLNRSVKFRSLDIEVPLSEIYAGIEFSPQSPKPESN